ncbi:nicotinate-nucleotide--dimethylbenzimidazole phosphoribosyltransferase [Streptomyces sp. NPDC056527]|uniref:nicotinate-nucleotide--dimethylbenzimidazole phosphoribosyltransferase n=1 Tax=Streptomyces sp. NPDC056527 TaxID=3345853 RepID=UPI0036921FBD
MTDTGQVPGEGLPENAGMVEQPGIPAPGAYTFLDPSENAAEDDDLLLMPGAQGAWSEHQPGAMPASPVAVPAPGMMPGQPQHMGDPLTDPLAGPIADALAAQAPVATAPQVVHETFSTPAHGVPTAQEPVLTDHGYEPGILDTGAHEAAGRDSGSVDLSAVRVPPPATAAPTPPPARRPLHMGPPMPEASGGVVRSLADRGPAGVPAAAPAPVTVPASVPVAASVATPTPMPMPAPMPAPMQGPPTTGPEYLDIPQEQPVAPVAPQLGDIPPQGAVPWDPQPQGPVAAPESAPQAAPAETVGQFVQVEGTVPTTPHLAPTPVVEVVEAAAEPVPAPEPMPEPVQTQAVEPVEEPAVEVVAEAPIEALVVTELPAEEVPAAVPAPRDGGPSAAVPVPPVEAEAEVAAEPVVEAEIQPEPVPEAAAEPVVEPVAEVAPEPESEPVAEAPAAEQPAADEPVVDEAAADEPVVDEPAVVEAVAEAGEQEEQPAPQAEVTVEAEVAEPVEAPEPLAAEEAAEPAAEAAEPAAEESSAEEPVAEDPEETQEPEALGAPAPGYAEAEREAVLRVMRERRDIRNGFRSDPIPHEVLLRVLEAAHTAPSVGHSQPWDFVVIRSAETRRSMHELAQRQREAYAQSLPKARAKQFKELKIEAILDTPVNIVVTADPTRGGRHTLGRYTQPQMAPYSSALAVENLWLAARAEGLGVGWVSFFDEREMVRALGLPEHLEVVAYLCVGYVDEFPEEPELMQAGWSKRRPLSWVVHEETYGRRALPGEEPHDLLQETIANIRPLDAKALGEAWERQKRMTKPAGALGMLEIISAQLSGLSRMCPPPIPEPAAVAIFAGDHGVHAQGVTAWPQEVTGQMVANFLGGGAVCNAFANQVGAEVCVIDVGVASDLPSTPGLLPRKVRAGTGDFTTGLAMTREEVLAAIEVGIETARDLVAAGNKALLTGEMGIANTTASAALISVYTGVDPVEVTGRGTGINDEMHARKVDVVRRALDLHKPDPADPIGVLSAIGGLEHAALVGLILGAASLRTPVVLDGVSTGAAALLARAIAPESLAACIAGHRSAEPGHVAALNKLGLRPLVDLDLRLGEGTGALLALPVVQSAARAMHEVATFDSAGVTEK